MALPNVEHLPRSAPRRTSVRRRPNAKQRDHIPARHATVEEKGLTRGLGWLSLGIGALEITASRSLATFLGVQNKDMLLRLLGARELATGLAIFAQPRPTTALWARVGGDVVDLALLLAALPVSTRRSRIWSTIAAVGGVTALDAIAADRLTRRSARGAAPADGSVEVTESISITASPADAYAYWRRLEQLPLFMTNLRRVEETGEGRSHWVASAPGGGTVEWDATITEEIPGERISWCSVDGASVPNSGTVRFTADPAGRGSIVEAELRYDPPLGGAGTLLASLLGEEPGQQVKEDLRRFKQMIETGEISTTQGQSSGRRAPAGAGEQKSARREVRS